MEEHFRFVPFVVMSCPTPDRKLLEEIWRQRLNDAKLRLDFTRNYLQEVRQDYSAGSIPENVEHAAHEQALRAEEVALAEYSQVLRIYDDLTTRGIIPDEDEWLRSASAGGLRV